MATLRYSLKCCLWKIQIGKNKLYVQITKNINNTNHIHRRFGGGEICDWRAGRYLDLR